MASFSASLGTLNTCWFYCDCSREEGPRMPPASFQNYCKCTEYPVLWSVPLRLWPYEHYCIPSAASVKGHKARSRPWFLYIQLAFSLLLKYYNLWLESGTPGLSLIPRVTQQVYSVTFDLIWHCPIYWGKWDLRDLTMLQRELLLTKLFCLNAAVSCFYTSMQSSSLT